MTDSVMKKKYQHCVNLQGEWKLRAEFLDVGPERFQEVLNHVEINKPFYILRESEHRKRHPNTFPSPAGSLNAKVPCDVLMPLIENGIVEEPLMKENARDLQWLCDLSWWFIRDFDVPDDILVEDEVHLWIEMLDYKADIILNGIPIGHHRNAFRPYDGEVKKYLKSGKNQLILRMTSGTEDYYIQDSLTYYCCTDDGTKNQRAYLRKPQFTYGWDWCPSIPTCGIGGVIELQGRSSARISGFRADTLKIEKNTATIRLNFEIEKTDMYSAEDAVLSYEIYETADISLKSETDEKQETDCSAMVYCGQQELYLTGGLNFASAEICIENPRLWWPNGYGRPDQYIVRARVVCQNVANDMEPALIGIRTIELCQDRLNADERRFDVVVNGIKIFCKGGNWVPPDSIYLRADEGVYRKLLKEAKCLNFNMLRVWGGGLYCPSYFYEQCSAYGIMVMQDFMYACGFYPDYLDWFMHEATLEAEYQVRRLAKYPSVVIWTGNNEIAESWTDWWRDDLHADYDYGKKIYHYMQPRVVRENSPCTPYMPSTPYFGKFTENVQAGKIPGMSSEIRWGKRANNPLCGDVHAWNYFFNDPCTKYEPETVFETFDQFPARFCSEFGFYGPLSKNSMQKCLGLENGEHMTSESSVWKFHGEKPEKRQMIQDMIRALFCEPEDLSEEEYLLYGGITQGILYQELAESIRYKEYGSGFLIWMFNDAWPETGWTVVDYYLNRKISYYYLKRAFRTQKMILRNRSDGKATLIVLNEENSALDIELVYGVTKLDGSSNRVLGEKRIIICPHSRYVMELENVSHTDQQVLYVRDKEGRLDSCIDARPYYRKMIIEEKRAEIVWQKKLETGDTCVCVKADSFIPCVYLKDPDEAQECRCDDNYFPMLPGEMKTVTIAEGSSNMELKLL